MGVTTFTEQQTSPVAPAKLFKALFTDAHNTLPKLLSQQIKNVEVGGGIAKTIFTEGSSTKYVKHKIDSVDVQNLTCKYTMIEGDFLGDFIESISYLVKFEPSGNGESVIKITSEYHTKGDTKLKEADIKAGQETALMLPKIVRGLPCQKSNCLCLRSLKSTAL